MTKDKKIEIRCTEKELNKWKIKAGIYTEGNLSEFVRFCLDNYKPNDKRVKKRLTLYR